MTRWFCFIPREPHGGAVVFGTKLMSPAELWRAVPEELKEPDPMWSAAYDLRPRWTTSPPKKQGWRRAHSKHIGGGVRVCAYTDYEAAKRKDAGYRA